MDVDQPCRLHVLPGCISQVLPAQEAYLAFNVLVSEIVERYETRWRRTIRESIHSAHCDAHYKAANTTLRLYPLNLPRQRMVDGTRPRKDCNGIRPQNSRQVDVA